MWLKWDKSERQDEEKGRAYTGKTEKSFLIIGMGRFGHHLCANLLKLENEVMIVDCKEEHISDMTALVTDVQIGDCTKEEVLRSIGVGNFDICFVCIGKNFQSSLVITSLLKEFGANYVVSLANEDIHAKFLLRNGADEVIYPDRDIAERKARRFSANHVFDYIELNNQYSIYEIPPMKEWVGQSIRSVDFRARYHVNILGIKKGGQMDLLPEADQIFHEDEHLLVMGRKEDVEKILKKL